MSSSSSPTNPVPIETEALIPAHPQFLGHPRPLYTLFFAELWERFSYYGMRALLTLYMVAPLAMGGMEMPTARATLIYGTYTMSVYMLSIPGGTMADNILGQRMAVLVGGIIIACGHFSMAFPSTFTFFLGLVLIVFGTGLLKPNISAMVGQLYAPGDNRRDAGFSIFYMGINVGALTAPFVTGFLAQHSAFKGMLESWGMNPAHSWHWGFAAAGVGMVVGLFVFVAFGGGLKEVGPAPAPVPGRWKKPLITFVGTLVLWGLVWLSDKQDWGVRLSFLANNTIAKIVYGILLAGVITGINLARNQRVGIWVVGACIALALCVWHVRSHQLVLDFTAMRYLFLLVPILLMLWFGLSPDPEARRLGAIFYFFIGAFVFWALFEQAGTSLSLFADRFTTTHVAGIEVPSSWYQSANPFFVICLAPLFAVLWTKLGDKQPSSPLKFTLGLFLLTSAFALMIPAAKLAVEGRVSPLWLLGLYFLQTMGEMCLSPVGLSTFTKLSPRHLVGAMMGIWFLGAAFGNKFAGVLAASFGEGEADHLDKFFGQQAAAMLGIGLVFLALVPWIKRRMGGVR